ncbi:hypothetical protein H9Q74_004350 [Fusarium xylarioides]|nr:hypothetical protein H9Q71_006787 [Fusarium xylarioides]KAG5825575.1 hypothetical protein H9Q74_004350 [Fusarium xylarioides]
MSCVLCAEETSHLWIRDFGPTFVRFRNGKLLRGVDWNFNYWGGKRAPSGDEHIAKIASQHITNSPPLDASIVTEGGAIEVDGEGTFMAAETAIINDNRNAGKTKEQIEGELSRLLGVQKFLWLAGEAGRETTDCHIDALARFIRPGVVVLSKPSPQGQGKYSFAYNDVRERLSKATNAQGKKIVLYDCLEPDLGKLQRVSEGENCVASYVNFLNVNGGIIIPKFGDEERDAQALELFKKLYPDMRVSQVFERSNFKDEIGAAITITPNGMRILHHFGFDPKTARGVQNKQMRMVHPQTFEDLVVENFSQVEDDYGAPFMFFHRVDLHTALKEMALSSDERYPEKAKIVLDNGETFVKYLVVVADGVRTKLIDETIQKDVPLENIGSSFYRCLIPFSEVNENPDLEVIFKNQDPGFWVLFDLSTGTFLVTYPCRD